MISGIFCSAQVCDAGVLVIGSSCKPPRVRQGKARLLKFVPGTRSKAGIPPEIGQEVVTLPVLSRNSISFQLGL